MNNLFEQPSVFHYILGLSEEEVQNFGVTIFKRLKQPKNKDFMLDVYFLLRKGFNPNTYISIVEQTFTPSASNYKEMFKTNEIKYHCFDLIIDLFEDYVNFEEEALLYFYLCGVDLDMECKVDDNEGENLTLREKIEKKWDEFEDFQEIENYSFSYIVKNLEIENPNRYGIDLENKKYLVEPLSEQCRQRCIKMYSNSFVSIYSLDEAVKAFNLELVSKNEDLIIDKSLTKFLMANIKNSSAYDTLLLLCNRLISLSSFDLQAIPQNKREGLVKLYKTPMYISNPKYKEEMFREYFGKLDVSEELIEKIKSDEGFRNQLIQKWRETKKRLIINQNINISDLCENSEPTIVNETDLLSENVFDFPNNFSIRKNNVIYVFTCNDIPSLKETCKNPYTNEAMNSVPTIPFCIPVTEFIDELVNGKKFTNQNINQINQEEARIFVFDIVGSEDNSLLNGLLPPTILRLIAPNLNSSSDIHQT